MLLRATRDGKRLITIPSDMSTEPATLWDLENYVQVARLTGHVGPTLSARFISGERMILTAGNDATARTWDAATGSPHALYRAGVRALLDADVTPDGALVAAAGGDGLVRFWDAATTRALWSLPVSTGPVAGIHFQDGGFLTRSLDGSVRRWELPKSQTVLDTCGRVPGCATVSK
jgi:WD40 repeat protein